MALPAVLNILLQFSHFGHYQTIISPLPQHTLRWQYDDIIGIDLFLLLQVYCWKA